MPRNGSGTYSLPSGNPVSAGTLIDATWANSTLNDIANELTDSLSRSGEGGMLAPFRLADGSQSTPGIAWSNEPSSGFYRAGTNDMWAVVGGTQIAQFTSTGMLGRFAAGAVTTPSVTVHGDTNTGIYFPAADEVAITTGGTQRLKVDSTGLVSVAGNLSVGGTLTLTGGLTLNGNVTVGDASSDTLTINSTLTSHLIFTDNTYDIGASGATRPRNVYVAGNGVFGGTLAVTGTSTLTGAVTANTFASSGATLTGGTINGMAIGGSTAAAGAFTTLSASSAASFAAGAVGTPSITATGDTNTGFWFPAADTIAASTGGAEAIRVSSAGNFGVGTTNPVERITAFTAAGTSVGLRSTDYTWVIDTVNSSGLFRIGRNDGVTATRLAIDSSGSVGVGTTTPTFGSGTGIEIERAGIATLRLENSTASNSFELYADSAANGINLRGRDSSPMNFWTGNTSRMTLDASGNLGIGTSSPGQKLTVAGAISISADATNPNSGVSLWSQAGIGATLSGFNLAFNTGSNGAQTEKMRLDNSGNLGIGVTPSAWGSNWKAIQSGDANNGTSGAVAFYALGANGVVLYANARNDNTNDKYVNTAPAGKYAVNGNVFQWFQAAQGNSGNNITFTQAMTLDASGNLGVGTTSPTSKLTVGDNTAPAINLSDAGGSLKATLVFRNSTTGNLELTNTTSAALVFGTNNTERARITSGGSFLIQTTDAGTTSGIGHKFIPDAAQPYISTVGSSTSNDNVSYSLYSTGASAYRFYVGYGGTVYATNTTISGLSDKRVKENIVDLDVGLDAVMALKPRKFDWKEGKGKDIKNDRGFIAQEFEQVFPDLIDTWKDPAPEGEEPYKSVRQDLIPVLVKAIQEQQAMIDDLKAKVSALETK